MLERQTRENNDYILWEDFRNGSESAFSMIYNDYVQELYRYGVRFNPEVEIVKDNIQELFIKLYNNRANLNPTDNIRLYLLRSLKNRLINVYFDRKESVSLDELPFEVLKTEDAEPGEDWDEIVRRKKLKKGIDSLTARQREAIYLRYTKEMTMAEMTELLDMNYQSVRNLLHRSIEKLRKEMLIILLLLHVFVSK
jgi:RNA polymerase sigma factor (sigma-70 family)